MPSKHLNLCCPLLFLHLIFPSIRMFSNESVLHITWPKYWSFSLSIRPSNECQGLLLGLTGLISLQYKGLSGVFFGTTFQKHQFFSAQRSLWSTSLFRIVSITRYTSLLRSDPIKGWKPPNLIRTNTRSALKQGFPTIAAWTPLL